MPAIPHGFLEPRNSDLQRMHEREHPLQIVDGVPTRQRLGECRTRFGRRQPDRRRRDDQTQFVGPGPPQGDRIRPVRSQHRLSVRRRAPAPRCRHALRPQWRHRAVPLAQGSGHLLEYPNPATVAAALLPSPAAIGMSLSTSTVTVGPAAPSGARRRIPALKGVPAVDRAGTLRHRQRARTSIADVDDAAPAGTAPRQHRGYRIRRPDWRPTRGQRRHVNSALSDTK